MNSALCVLHVEKERLERLCLSSSYVNPDKMKEAETALSYITDVLNYAESIKDVYFNNKEIQ